MITCTQVLGRSRSGTPDATQQAVVGITADERQGRAVLTDDERQQWDTVVTAYVNGLSRQQSMFQPPLAPITLTLAGTGDTAVPATALDSRRESDPHGGYAECTAESVVAASSRNER